MKKEKKISSIWFSKKLLFINKNCFSKSYSSFRNVLKILGAKNDR